MLQFDFDKDDTENIENEDYTSCIAVVKNMNIVVEEDKVYANIWIYNSAAALAAGGEPKRKIQVSGPLSVLGLNAAVLMTAAETFLLTTSRFTGATPA